MPTSVLLQQGVRGNRNLTHAALWFGVNCSLLSGRNSSLRAPGARWDCTRPITRGRTRNGRCMCASSGLLATNLPLRPRRIRLPVALRVDLLLPPRQHVLRGDVTRGAVQADVVVVVQTLRAGRHVNELACNGIRPAPQVPRKVGSGLHTVSTYELRDRGAIRTKHIMCVGSCGGRPGGCWTITRARKIGPEASWREDLLSRKKNQTRARPFHEFRPILKNGPFFILFEISRRRRSCSVGHIGSTNGRMFQSSMWPSVGWATGCIPSFLRCGKTREVRFLRLITLWRSTKEEVRAYEENP